MTILFENDDLIAIDKPAGLLSHASVDRTRPDAVRRLHAWLTKERGAPPRLGLLHRLDRDTSGVLLLSKNPANHERYAALFRGRGFEKTYLGVVRGRPRSAEWRVENHLAPENTPASKTPRTIAVTSGGEKAITDFRVMASHKGLSLVMARPLTGRRHQIRAHLQQSGWPLVGDRLYGGPPGPRVLLHAWKLAWNGEEGRVVVQAAVPADFPLTP